MKKGFTLIEMLAVVVILGVLATVTISVTTTLLNKSEMSSFKDSGIGIIKVAKEAYLDYSGSNFKVDLTNKIIYVDGSKTNEKLVYNGLNPKLGTVEIDSNGKVSLILSDGVYCAYKQKTESEVSVFKLSDSSKTCDLNSLK